MGRINSANVVIITATNNCVADFKLTENALSKIDKNKFEWIVVDNCSVDGTAELVSQSDCVSTYIIETDNGIYDAWNKALNEISSTKWVLFIGAGDLVYPEWIGFLNSCEYNVDLLYSDLLIVDGRRSYLNKSINFTDASRKLPYQMSIPHPGMAHNYSLFQTDRFDTTYKIISDWIFIAEKNGITGRYIEGYVQASFKIGGVSTSYKHKSKLYDEIQRYYQFKNMILPKKFVAKKYIIDSLSSLKNFFK